MPGSESLTWLCKLAPFSSVATRGRAAARSRRSTQAHDEEDRGEKGNRPVHTGAGRSMASLDPAPRSDPWGYEDDSQVARGSTERPRPLPGRMSPRQRMSRTGVLQTRLRVPDEAAVQKERALPSVWDSPTPSLAP